MKGLLDFADSKELEIFGKTFSHPENLKVAAHIIKNYAVYFNRLEYPALVVNTETYFIKGFESGQAALDFILDRFKKAGHTKQGQINLLPNHPEKD